MGLSNTVHWVSWFITSFVSILITIIILVLLLKYGKIFMHSDITVIIFVLCLFATASIAMTFLVSVFFSRANISAACGGIIYCFTYLPYPISLWFEEDMTFSQNGLVVRISVFWFFIRYFSVFCLQRCILVLRRYIDSFNFYYFFHSHSCRHRLLECHSNILHDGRSKELGRSGPTCTKIPFLTLHLIWDGPWTF